VDGCENGAAGDEVMARELEVVDDHPELYDECDG
jgi:hypothetical protein